MNVTERIIKLTELSDTINNGYSSRNERGSKSIIHEKDCSQLLNVTSRELKSLKYKASKIMCGDDLHIKADKNDRL